MPSNIFKNIFARIGV